MLAVLSLYCELLQTLDALIYKFVYNYYFLILPILAMMPEDKDSDFDIHLQHSISALQSINNAMQFDVVVLYCSDDIPSKTNPGVDPFKIRDELKNWGFSV